MCPDAYESALCSVCAITNATLTHILWDCTRNPVEAAAQERLPDNIANAITSPDYAVQLQAVQQLEAALARQKRGEARAGGPRGLLRRPAARRTGGRRQGKALKT